MEAYTVEHVIEVMGGGRKLSSLLNIKESNCSQWLKAGRIPAGKAWEIADLSKKKLTLCRMPVK